MRHPYWESPAYAQRRYQSRVYTAKAGAFVMYIETHETDPSDAADVFSKTHGVYPTTVKEI